MEYEDETSEFFYTIKQGIISGFNTKCSKFRPSEPTLVKGEIESQKTLWNVGIIVGTTIGKKKSSPVLNIITHSKLTVFEIKAVEGKNTSDEKIYLGHGHCNRKEYVVLFLACPSVEEDAQIAPQIYIRFSFNPAEKKKAVFVYKEPSTTVEEEEKNVFAAHIGEYLIAKAYLAGKAVYNSPETGKNIKKNLLVQSIRYVAKEGRMFLTDIKKSVFGAS